VHTADYGQKKCVLRHKLLRQIFLPRCNHMPKFDTSDVHMPDSGTLKQHSHYVWSPWVLRA